MIRTFPILSAVLPAPTAGAGPGPGAEHPLLALARDPRDPAAWAALVEHQMPRCWGIAVRCLGPGDAADAVQEAMLAMRAGAGRFRVPAGAAPDAAADAWVARVAVNTCLRLRRRRRREVPLAAVAALGAPEPPAEPDEALAGRVHAALAVLPSSQREAVALRYLAGLDTEGVAAALGIQTGAVRVRIHRGLERLRRILGLPGGTAMSGLVAAAFGEGVPLSPPPADLAGGLLAVPAPAAALAWLSVVVAAVLAAGVGVVWVAVAGGGTPPAAPATVGVAVVEPPPAEPPTPLRVATVIPALLAVAEEPPERALGSSWELGMGLRWLGDSGPRRPVEVPPGRWWAAAPRAPLTPGSVRDLVRRNGVPGLLLGAEAGPAMVDLADPAFAGLRALRLVNRRISATEAAAIGRMTGLRDLALVGATGADDRLALGLAGLRELEHLDLSGSEITATGARALAALPGLRSLSLDMCQSLDGAVLAELGALRGLRALRWSPIGSTGVRALGMFPALESLRIADVGKEPVRDGDLAVLAGRRGLRTLDILGTDRLTPAGLRDLAGLTGLAWLRVRSVPGADDTVLASLAGLSELRELSWGWTGADGSGLSALADLPIERLTLAGPSVTATGVASVGRLRRLAKLDLITYHHPEVAAAAVAALADARSPVRDLVLRSTDAATLDRVRELPALEHLRLHDPRITDSGILARLPPLRTLELRSAKIPPGALEILAGREDIEDLSLSGTALAAGAVAVLARMPSLRRLDLDDTGLDREGLAALVGHPALREVSVRQNHGLTQQDVKAFRRAMPAVEVEGAEHLPCDCPDRVEPPEPPPAVFPTDGFG
ncbi:MAG: hypothetical protein RLZZ127_1037 [Planctomycetota bacterium]|jgi:RNA polymerase sigma-70 factor (ECF subfamily)